MYARRKANGYAKWLKSNVAFVTRVTGFVLVILVKSPLALDQMVRSLADFFGQAESKLWQFEVVVTGQPQPSLGTSGAFAHLTTSSQMLA